MKTILVATDLTERSDRAMDRAALLAKQTGAALHVIHVVDDEVSDVIARAVEKNAKAELQRQVKSDPFFKDLKCVISVVFGDPWKKIVEIAHAFEADLVVMGAHRNRGFRELFGGTTLHRIAKSCSQPMLIAVERALADYKNVLVGVDFSECARHAADLATAIAPQAPPTMVHAYHIPFKGLTTRTDVNGDIALHEKVRIEGEIDPQMKIFLASLQSPVGETKVKLVEGGPVVVLNTLARSLKADLVCVGTNAKPWLVEALLGSTAYELLSYPPCDVLIAPLKKPKTI